MKKNKNLAEKGWPIPFFGSQMSNICIVRELSDKVTINCVHPGYVKTRMTTGIGDLFPSKGVESIVKLALSPPCGPKVTSLLKFQAFKLSFCDYRLMSFWSKVKYLIILGLILLRLINLSKITYFGGSY